MKRGAGWLAAASVPQRLGAEPQWRALATPRSRAYPGLNREREGRWNGAFFFIQMGDTQFGMFANDLDFRRETELVTRAVARINTLRPRFVIVCGDLVNQVPGGAVHAAQVAEYQRLMGEVDPAIPLVCVCGNHDVGNRPTPASIASYRRDFGDDYFGFWVGGVRCLVLNSSLYSDPTGAPNAYAEQDRWIRGELSAARAVDPVHLLVFQHHPWFLERPDEPDQYFNIPSARRMPMLQALRDAGVRAVLAGHYHRNAYGRDGAMEMITTSAVGKPLGKDPSGFRIVEVYRQRIAHRYYGLDDVPEQVRLEERG